MQIDHATALIKNNYLFIMPVKSPQQSRSEHTITFIITIVIKCEVFANALCITYSMLRLIVSIESKQREED